LKNNERKSLDRRLLKGLFMKKEKNIEKLNQARMTIIEQAKDFFI